MIRWFRGLRRAGVLGMNQRNADFILKYNPRRNFPLVDDKLITKRRARAAGIRVPELYGVIQIEHQIRHLERIVDGRASFVIKPAQGSGGNGILVIHGRRNGHFRKADGQLIPRDAVAHHISNILSGMHSLGGQPDRAIIEQRVVFDPVFDEVSHRGVPDIRTVVFQGVPVMAMVRLPTRQSDDKANLHQGAVGAGLDMRTGHTTTAVWLDRFITTHPDTGASLTGLPIPRWQDVLELSARCHALADLGYLGVDIVLDRNEGPMVLELNARPGLSIQLANRTSLLKCLLRVEALDAIPSDPRRRVELSRELFTPPDAAPDPCRIPDVREHRRAS